ncbi:Uncharacterised protein [uncultured archaeon]|nr:Uncharacterised protein [uncultured archaeon]
MNPVACSELLQNIQLMKPIDIDPGYCRLLPEEEALRNILYLCFVIIQVIIIYDCYLGHLRLRR